MTAVENALVQPISGMLTPVRRMRGVCAPRELADASDADLIHRYNEGNAEAFGVLYARHQPLLWSAARRTNLREDDAAECVQDAMIKAMKQAKGFRGECQVTSWLHRIVVSTCVDRIRREQARPAVPVDPGLVAEVLRGRASGENLENHVAIRHALAQIPPEQAEALILVVIGGRSVQEVAAACRCAEGTIKSRCHRAKHKLHELLEEGGW